MYGSAKLILWVQQVLDRMVQESGLDVRKRILVSDEMETAIYRWSDIYNNHPPWMSHKDGIVSMGLGGSVASELSMLTTLELKSEITGSQLADYLNMSYQSMLSNIRENTEYGCAKGGIIFKPYFTGKEISVDTVQADCFFPTAFDGSKRMIGAAFADQIHRNGKIYTKIEWQEMLDMGYQVFSKAFMSSTEGALGTEIPLEYVPEWKETAPRIVFSPDIVKHPLFGYFRVPRANRTDNSSPLGPSVFSGAEDMIRIADEQFSRAIREYEMTEPALYISNTMLQTNKDGTVAVASGKDRVYRKLDIVQGMKDDPFFKEWMPAIRDQSLFNGLNKELQRIEFECGLAYGTLSDVQIVDKTAEEIRTSKQRSYSTVSDLQKALERAMRETIEAMAEYARIFRLAPDGEYDISFDFDDSIIIDSKSEQVIRMQEVNAGLIRPEEYLMWRYGVTEEQAREMMPKSTDDVEGTAAIDKLMNNWAKDNETGGGDG